MGRILAAFILALLSLRPAFAGEVTVAVAANFLTTAEALAEAFESETGHEVVLSHGATGQLYAQIANGAPVDVFLAADARRPALLREAGLASRSATYALGRLVLVSRQAVTAETATEDFAGKRVALADPMLAPYGLAATSAMERLGLDTATFQPLIVANVGQAATLFVTGNADLAFLAASQLGQVGAEHVLDLDGRYPPIRQDAALLARADGNDAAAAFWDFLFGAAARDMIAAAGYALPE